MNPQLLLMDSDQRSNEHLRGLLHPRFEITVAPTMEEAHAFLARQAFDLVIADFEILRAADANFFQTIHQVQQNLKIGLISALDTEHYVAFLLKWRCFHVLPKLPFYNARDVLLFVENILQPMNAFGLPRYLADDAEWNRMHIKDRRDKIRTVEDIVNYFASCEYEIHELYDVRLIIEEGINNALFHAFRDDAGREKYRPNNFCALDPSEELRLEYGSDATAIGFSVTDNRGLLTPEQIISKLSRQYNREGLFDESGRGLYLARMLSGQIIFNIEKGKRTQIICLFYEKRINVPKPFSINYIE